MHSLSCIQQCISHQKHASPPIKQSEKAENRNNAGYISPLVQHSVATITAMFEKGNTQELLCPQNLSHIQGTPKKITTKGITFDYKHQEPQIYEQSAKQDVRYDMPASPTKPPRKGFGNNSKPNGSKHLLILAAKEGNLEVVQWLLEHGADPATVDSKGRNALLTASAADRLGVFKYLIQALDINQTDVNGWNALHIAVVAGHRRIVEESLKHFSIQSRTLSGLTALSLAVNRGHLHMVSYLLKEKADVEVSSVHGWTPLHFAARENSYFILRELLNSVKNKAFFDFETLERLTPLAVAVQYRSLDCVKLLLDCGANPNTRDSNGWTPARIAAINNYHDIAKYLANYKAVM